MNLGDWRAFMALEIFPIESLFLFVKRMDSGISRLRRLDG